MLCRWLLILLASSVSAEAHPSASQGDVGTPQTLTDPVYVRPIYGAYRRCGGACLKSGLLTWFCEENTGCALNCAIGPPVRRCVTSGSVIEDFRILN